ncbi:hypothetical protein [Stutzerimonas azotifigens]|nr:hypothetical protein [Stutzerimonas azotifigens]
MLSLHDIDGRSVLTLNAPRLEAGGFTVFLGHNGSGNIAVVN